MTGAEVIELVLNQIGEIRIPFKDRETIQQLETISCNLIALREAILKNHNEPETENKPEEVTEDV